MTRIPPENPAEFDLASAPETTEEQLPEGLLDLNVPAHWVQGTEPEANAKERVEFHLVQAMNALNEAAGYTNRELYLTALNVVHAVYEATTAHEIELLKTIQSAAVKVLKTVDAEQFVASTPQGLAASKVSFLRFVKNALALAIPEYAGKNDARLNFEALANAARGVLQTQTAPPARGVAASTIMLSLLFEFPQLHKASVRSDQAHAHVEQFVRVLEYLVDRDQATYIQVARAALFVLGVSHTELKNFFSPACIEEADRARTEHDPSGDKSST